MERSHGGNDVAEIADLEGDIAYLAELLGLTIAKLVEARLLTREDASLIEAHARSGARLSAH